MRTRMINRQQKWLRFILPFPIGVVVYILILLVFDSLEQLGSNFFSQEVLVTIFLSFVLLESQRLLLSIIDRRFPLQVHLQSPEEEQTPAKSVNHSLRIILIPFICLLFSLVLITLLVSIYFLLVLRINDFNTELIVFNGVYGIVAILYSIIHVSTSFLAVHKQIHYKQEKELRKGMETDLKKFKMQINPKLLYDSLENLISIVHVEPKLAEQFVSHLSKIYRYNLDNRHVELVDLKCELDLSKSLLHLLNVRHKNLISFEHNLPSDWLANQVIPCTISTLIQEAVNRSIVNTYQPIVIRLDKVGDQLIFACNDNPKIGLNGESNWDLSLINKAYSFYNNQQLEITQNNQQLHINIPLFEIEEE